MTNQPSLITRFAFGSTDISIPGTPHHDFFFGMPRDVHALTRLGSELVKQKRSALKGLEREYGRQSLAFGEIAGHLESLAGSFSSGIRDVSEAIYAMEDNLSANLTEVKWVLGQADERLAELVKLARFPRETEARELIEDGMKALATRNLDDAEHCFALAVEKKRTSFQANLNLAFTYLHKNDAQNAITRFKKAVDYAPGDKTGDAHIMALECLARAYYVAKDYTNARRIMAQARMYRNTAGRQSSQSDYHYASYVALSGDENTAVKLLVRLWQIEPRFLALAVTDTEFLALRSKLLDSVDAYLSNQRLTSERDHTKALFERANSELMAEIRRFETESKEKTDDAAQELISLIDRAAEYLRHGTSEDFRRCDIVCEHVIAMVSIVRTLHTFRIELQHAERAELKAKLELVSATDELPDHERDFPFISRIAEGVADLSPEEQDRLTGIGKAKYYADARRAIRTELSPVSQEVLNLITENEKSIFLPTSPVFSLGYEGWIFCASLLMAPLALLFGIVRGIWLIFVSTSGTSTALGEHPALHAMLVGGECALIAFAAAVFFFLKFAFFPSKAAIRERVRKRNNKARIAWYASQGKCLKINASINLQKLKFDEALSKTLSNLEGGLS